MRYELTPKAKAYLRKTQPVKYVLTSKAEAYLDAAAMHFETEALYEAFINGLIDWNGNPLRRERESDARIVAATRKHFGSKALFMAYLRGEVDWDGKPVRRTRQTQTRRAG